MTEGSQRGQGPLTQPPTGPEAVVSNLHLRCSQSGLQSGLGFAFHLSSLCVALVSAQMHWNITAENDSFMDSVTT